MPHTLRIMLPACHRALLLDRAEELGLADSGLPFLLEELARWLPTATIEQFLEDLSDLADC